MRLFNLYNLLLFVALNSSLDLILILTVWFGATRILTIEQVHLIIILIFLSYFFTQINLFDNFFQGLGLWGFFRNSVQHSLGVNLLWPLRNILLLMLINLYNVKDLLAILILTHSLHWTYNSLNPFFLCLCRTLLVEVFFVLLLLL
jgi:hypothetical protein